ncbi:hypothetical protein B1R32_1411, partial [Abditibacterium utsteinense]
EETFFDCSSHAFPNGCAVALFPPRRKQRGIQSESNEIGNVSVPIAPEVDEYDIQGQYLVGHAVEQVGQEIPNIPGAMDKQNPGYFIIDTQNNSVTSGLDKKRWRAKLLQLGVKDIQLKKTAYEANKNNKY